MKLRAIRISVSLLLCPFLALCQSFIPGHILKGENDKTSGFVSFNPYKAKDKILFKVTKDAAAEEITANEITGFYLNNYRLRFISVVDTTTKRTIFAQVI